jgi:hypothetical protein
MPDIRNSGECQPVAASVTQALPRVLNDESCPPSALITITMLAEPDRILIHKRIAIGMWSIGRCDESDLVLPDRSVSRNHAALVLEGTRLLVEDAGSRNGTYLRGKDRLIRRFALDETDWLLVGPYRLDWRWAS